jgi:hypothetical protein
MIDAFCTKAPDSFCSAHQSKVAKVKLYMYKI